ncbi:MAG: hypothetical protein ABIR58_04080 [Gemmatimonadaceae bacterium]
MTAAADDAPGRTPPRSFFVSLGVHLLLAAVLVKFLISPSAFSMIFGRTASPAVPAERIGFLALPTAAGPPVEGRSGGDGRPIRQAPVRRLVAPASVPATIPEPTIGTRADPDEGTGPLIGGGGPSRGIRPRYSDPRLWAAPGDLLIAPKTATQRLDSVIATIIQPFNDSVAIASGQRKPGDWTFEKDGRKYGIDPQFIRLGNVSIPTALLALLPINMTGNPTVNERNRAQNQLHADIFSQAQRGMNEADFKKAVKSIRERKERERAAAFSSSDKKTRPADEPASGIPPGQD